MIIEAPIAGTKSAAGWSSDTRPCSTICNAATDAIALVIEAIQNRVSPVIGAASATPRWP